MINKGSILQPVDNCGIRLVRCFGHYSGGLKKYSKIAHFIKVSIRAIFYIEILIKNKITNILPKGTKRRAYIVRTKFRMNKIDGGYIKFHENSCLLLRKRMTAVGSYIFGPFIYNTNRKRVQGSFIIII